MKFENEEAVSPVIGVILMVAITVILAAVIAAFVFGMAGTTSTTKNVGVIVTEDAAHNGQITWQGGTDMNKITGYNAYLNTSSSTAVFTGAGTPVVGQVDTTTSAITGSRVLITASFSDGATQVVYDKQF